MAIDLKIPPQEMETNAALAANFLKTMAHEGRLMILCHLGSGEKSVSELEDILNCRQAAVSQMLAACAKMAWLTPAVTGKPFTIPWQTITPRNLLNCFIICSAVLTRNSSKRF